MSITYKKLVDHYFGASNISWFAMEASRLMKQRASMHFPFDDKCYIQRSYAGGYAITLGKKFYVYNVLNKELKDHMDKKDIKSTYKDMSAITKGALYHEVSHFLYTDMVNFTEYIKLLSKKGYPHLAAIFRTFSNVVEDVVIEDEFEYYQPVLGKFLKYLRLRLFTQETIDEFQSKMVDDDPNDLFSYLFYRYRVPSRVKFEHPMYTADKKLLHSCMYLLLNTADPTLRIKRTLAFAWGFFRRYIDSAAEPIEIAEVIKGKDRKWIESLPDIPKPKTPPTPKHSSSPTDMDEDDPTASSGGTPSSTSAPSEGTESVEDVEDVEDEAREAVEQDRGVARRGGSAIEDIKPLDSKLTPDPDKDSISHDIIRNAASDEPSVNFAHTLLYLHDHLDMNKYDAKYMDIVKEYEDQINKLVNLVRKMKAVNNNRYLRQQKKGKLDKRAITKESDTLKVFKRRLAPRPEADLAFSFLIDLSGSMIGEKSIIVGTALIILQETLYRLNVPFEVSAFTEYGNTAITIDFHRFGDNFKKTKLGACVFTSQIRVGPPLHTFFGNVDESNLQFVGTRFLATRQEKDKILIVLSDGATTGSDRLLSKVSQSFQKKGLTLLGIGIVDDNVEGIYSDHHVFSSTEDLKNMASVLQKYILNKVFK